LLDLSAPPKPSPSDPWPTAPRSPGGDDIKTEIVATRSSRSIDAVFSAAVLQLAKSQTEQPSDASVGALQGFNGLGLFMLVP
jgi:hypothetical protein